jgi:hypothetical protein
VSDTLDAGVRRIHVDVMDGHFVPNLSMGPLVVAALWPLAEGAGAVLEVHLMIAEPDRYVDALPIKAFLALRYVEWAEALLLAGSVEKARLTAERAVELAVVHHERGNEAWA